MRAVIDELAADWYAGRRVGTPDGRAAAAWLTEHLAGLGASVGMKEFAMAGAVREVYATPTLRWSAAADEDHPIGLVHRWDFSEHLASADQPGPIAGPVTLEAVAGAWLWDIGLSAERIQTDAESEPERGDADRRPPQGTRNMWEHASTDGLDGGNRGGLGDERGGQQPEPGVA